MKNYTVLKQLMKEKIKKKKSQKYIKINKIRFIKILLSINKKKHNI